MSGVVSVLVVLGTTNAAFTATTSTGTNSWTAGAVAVSNDASAYALFSEGASGPGGTGARCVTVTYTGSLAAGVRLYATGLTGALAPYLDVTIALGSGDTTGGSCAAFTMSNELFNGTLTSLATAAHDFGSGIGGFSPSAGPASVAYRISWELDDAAPDAAQNATTGATVTWEARDDATSSAPAPTYPTIVKGDGATGLWRLDEPTGTTATDQVNGANGTYTPTGLTRGVPGPGAAPGAATTFAGTSGQVTVPGPAAGSYQFSGTSPFTFEAWIRRPDHESAWTAIAGKSDYTSFNDRQGWSVWLTPDNDPWAPADAVRLERWSGTDDGVYSATLTPDVWHHVVATYDGTTMRVYVDGQLQGTLGSTRSTSATSAPLEIGYADYGGYAFNGSLADVAVYPAALTPAQIQAHHTAR